MKATSGNPCIPDPWLPCNTVSRVSGQRWGSCEGGFSAPVVFRTWTAFRPRPTPYIRAQFRIPTQEMSVEVKKEIELEIAHVLFIDTVGYSKLLIDDQRTLIDTLNQIVRGTAEFQSAEAARKLIKIATGDGMALVCYTRPQAPVECALQISRGLKEHPELRLRMGVHSGPVSGVIDVNERANVAGAGINMARRVMECGGAGHRLLSQRIGGG